VAAAAASAFAVAAAWAQSATAPKAKAKPEAEVGAARVAADAAIAAVDARLTSDPPTAGTAEGSPVAALTSPPVKMAAAQPLPVAPADSGGAGRASDHFVLAARNGASPGLLRRILDPRSSLSEAAIAAEARLRALAPASAGAGPADSGGAADAVRRGQDDARVGGPKGSSPRGLAATLALALRDDSEAEAQRRASVRQIVMARARPSDAQLRRIMDPRSHILAGQRADVVPGRGGAGAASPQRAEPGGYRRSDSEPPRPRAAGGAEASAEAGAYAGADGGDPEAKRPAVERLMSQSPSARRNRRAERVRKQVSHYQLQRILDPRSQMAAGAL
jgi:hypothetical protein